MKATFNCIGEYLGYEAVLYDGNLRQLGRGRTIEFIPTVGIYKVDIMYEEVLIASYIFEICVGHYKNLEFGVVPWTCIRFHQ